MLYKNYKTWLYSILLALALALIVMAGTIYLSPGDILAQSPDTDCAKDGSTCPMTGDFGPISVGITTTQTTAYVTAPGAPAFGALIYDPDFKRIEQEARARLKRGLEAREALSPYKGNVDFDTYVKKFDYEAGWNRAYSGYDPYGDTLTLIDLIDKADQDLREARDLYAYLLVYAPEYRFRADGYYISDVHTDQGYTEPLCGVTDKEDPDPADPQHSGQVLDPVIDWCNFRARLRQSVREAAHLRMLFGQQFMVDAMGLHFSGTQFFGGEEAVRWELAQFRAAQHQFELAEQGLTEALDRAVGSGCYVSDFYTQSEWSLMSRAIENQEVAQHHIGVRLSYMDIDSPETAAEAQAAAQGAFRQASVNGYIKLIGMTSLGAAQPLGVGCDKGERPDGLLAAEMALNLAETRRKAHELADGRNIFGFDVTFTPARAYKSSVPLNCETSPEGDRGLWDEAYCLAQQAQLLQDHEVYYAREFEDSQAELREEIETILDEIDARISNVSGCNYDGDFGVLETCVNNQKSYLNTCGAVITSTVEYIPSEFDKCMSGTGYPLINNGEAKQALYDLRNIYVQFVGIQKKANNINDRIKNSNDRNSTVTDWLAASGAAETAARVTNAAQLMVNCWVTPKDPWEVPGAMYKNSACSLAGAFNIVAQATAGSLSTAADCEIENAKNKEATQNLLLDQTELLIDAYAAQQQWFSKLAAFNGLLAGLDSDLTELERQLAYFKHSPANDPSFRMVRDSYRMMLANELEKAARIAYLAARRSEYEYAGRLAASNFRISDIYKARIAEDITNYLLDLQSTVDNLPGAQSPQINQKVVTISVARHVMGLTDAYVTGVLTDSTTIEAKRAELFREILENEGYYKADTGVLKYPFTTSLNEGALFSNLIPYVYDRYWLHKLSGVDMPTGNYDGVMVNLVAEGTSTDSRSVTLTQGGLVHMRSFAGCIFDYRLIAPAVLLGLDWPSTQPPEEATVTFDANVNETNPWTGSYRVSTFYLRPVSATDWVIELFLGGPTDPARINLQQLTDIELIFDTTYASRQPGVPELSECVRIDY